MKTLLMILIMAGMLATPAFSQPTLNRDFQRSALQPAGIITIDGYDFVVRQGGFEYYTPETLAHKVRNGDYPFEWKTVSLATLTPEHKAAMYKWMMPAPDAVQMKIVRNVNYNKKGQARAEDYPAGWIEQTVSLQGFCGVIQVREGVSQENRFFWIVP